MTRVKRGVQTNRKHKKIIKLAKGFRSVRSRTFKSAKQAVMKSGANAYRDRRLKKRTFRNLWSARISAAVRAEGWNYSRFIGALFKKKIVLDRKMLSELAYQEPEAFKDLVRQVRGE